MNTTTLTPHQQEIFNDLTKGLKSSLEQYFRRDDHPYNHLFSLTGAAGTGKSHLTVQIVADVYKMIRSSKYQHDNIWITAPTHKAVGILRDEMKKNEIKNIICTTIHSFLKLKLKRDFNTGAEKYVADKFDQNQHRASLLVIDESSMVSDEIYNLVLEAVATRKVHAVLFVGDPYQLLPVSNNGENKVYMLKNQYQLTQIVRQQEDNAIITLSQKIKNCIKEQSFPKLDSLFEDIENSKDIEIFTNKDNFMEDFYKNKNWNSEDKIFTSFTNETVESINELIRQQYWNEQGISNPDFLLAGDTLRFKSSLNDDGINSAKTNGVFCNDEEVILESAEMQYHNELGIKYWMCQVVNRKNSKFYVLDPDSLITFNKILQNIAIDAKNASSSFNRGLWRKYFMLKNSFANVNYSYAATIHKLQGSTYDTVYIDLNSLMHSSRIDEDFRYRLVYVAITRARKNVKILF